MVEVALTGDERCIKEIGEVGVCGSPLALEEDAIFVVIDPCDGLAQIRFELEEGGINLGAFSLEDREGFLPIGLFSGFPEKLGGAGGRGWRGGSGLCVGFGKSRNGGCGGLCAAALDKARAGRLDGAAR